MKVSIRVSLPLFCLLLTALACQEDEAIVNVEESPSSKSYANVSPQLWDYFQRFEEEAASRGFSIDLNNDNLEADIEEISEDYVAGTCTFHSQMPNRIIIDEGFWSQSSDLFREMVIFHELGHCVLYRGHREDAFGNGACVSIMRSGVDGCSDNYRQNTRAYYLDELFGLTN